MQKHPIKHILVIRLSAMGDVAMTVPVLERFIETYPEIRITVLTRAFFTPIFSELRNVSVVAADVKGKHKGVVGLYRLFLELKKLNIDAVADLHNVLRSNILKRFFAFSGIKVFQIDKGRAEKKALTRIKNKDFKPLKTTHQRYADVFKYLGFPIDLSITVKRERIKLTPQISEILPETGQKWIGIAPFAQHQGKIYPLERIEEVIAALDKESRFQLLLFGGGKKEKDILNNLGQKYKNAVSIAGKLRFSEELKLIANLDMMVSMDSGNAHLAAMFGVPTITIWGVTHPYAGFMPFGQPLSNAVLPDLVTYDQIPTSIYGNKVPEGYEKVMYSITAEQVLQKIYTIEKNT
ncbi:glycosyltransferase family 9 protein [Aquimarina hainanensis]|uniref:Glycosyltransferase family 9 protein n=1 Tax=Aquimarina hainanensis TaxID=1578017 RepID=A0ABW5N7Y0_9FLAO